MLWRDSGMFAWNKMAVTQSCLFDYAVRESSSFISKCYRNKGKTKEMFKFIAHCAFQKHANSEVQKPTDVCVLADLLGKRTLLRRVQKFMVCGL